MKFTVFWDVAPCSQVIVDRRFRGAYCLHHQGVRISETSVNNDVTEDSKLLIFYNRVLEHSSLLIARYGRYMPVHHTGTSKFQFRALDTRVILQKNILSASIIE
jgi:hypothetical protein